MRKFILGLYWVVNAAISLFSMHMAYTESLMWILYGFGMLFLLGLSFAILLMICTRFTKARTHG